MSCRLFRSHGRRIIAFETQSRRTLVSRAAYLALGCLSLRRIPSRRVASCRIAAASLHPAGRQKRIKSVRSAVYTRALSTRRVYGSRHSYFRVYLVLLPSSPRDLHFDCSYFARRYWSLAGRPGLSRNVHYAYYIM